MLTVLSSSELKWSVASWLALTPRIRMKPLVMFTNITSGIVPSSESLARCCQRRRHVQETEKRWFWCDLSEYEITRVRVPLRQPHRCPRRYAYQEWLRSQKREKCDKVVTDENKAYQPVGGGSEVFLRALHFYNLHWLSALNGSGSRTSCPFRNQRNNQKLQWDTRVAQIRYPLICRPKLFFSYLCILD